MSEHLRFGCIEVRPALRQVRVDGKPVVLGSRAFDVMMALVERRDRLVSKAELMDAAWPGVIVEENNLSVQISALRRALGPDAIATVTGRGYRFTPAPTEPNEGETGLPPGTLDLLTQRLDLLAQRPRIAVLPFDCEDGSLYFGDGITEEIAGRDQGRIAKRTISAISIWAVIPASDEQARWLRILQPRLHTQLLALGDTVLAR